MNPSVDQPGAFHLVDGMVLVGATAAGLGAARQFGIGARLFLLKPPWDEIYLTASCLGLSLTVAILGLAVWVPRPARRQACQKPGTAAGFTVIVVALWGCMFELGEKAVAGRLDDLTDTASAVLAVVVIFQAGPAVAAVWAVAALGGRWDADPSWIDRAGRALGAFWISMGLIYSVINSVQ